MALETGTLLGPYEILGPLGAGGMGEVYRARDRRLGREVAVKVLHPAIRADPERLTRFEAEARITGALNHPNILIIHDVGTHAGEPYVVSELLEGQTLAERLDGSPLPFRKAVDCARQIASGLAAAHDKGVVHRDLKPGNVMIGRDGRVKILDFGLARLVQEETEPDQAATAGRVLGTVGYMAPEQVRAQPADARSDIFSFGAVLYEMLTGRRAFQGGSAVETANAILKQDPPPLSDLEPLPLALERIVWRCLEKSPQERFQSARDLAFDLETLSSISSGPLLAAPARALARRFRWAPLAWLLAGAGMVAVLAFLWAGPTGSPPAFKRLTFRRGTIESARFAPDGQTVVYGAAWAAGPVEVFAARSDSPESRPLGFPSTELLALSAKGEMALSLGRRRIGTFVGEGRLARAALAGGVPRELEDGVQQADWAPDGRTLAVVRTLAGRNRLEFPIGKVLYETSGWVGDPRFAPDGGRIAFLDHPVWGDDGGNLAVVDLAGVMHTLTRNWSSLQGLAWHPSGREVWFTGTREGSARALHAVTVGGRERVVFRMPGTLTLHDLAQDGRVLLTHHTLRREVLARLPGVPELRDLTWLDYSYPADLSDDGSALYFAENGEGGGRGYAVYLRRTDGSPAVRLGEGAALALSPDGRRALASVNYTSDAPQLALLPTGVGEPRRLPRGDLNTQAAAFFPDGRRLLLAGSRAAGSTRTWVQDAEGGDPQPLSPDGTRFPLSTRPISPDGRAIVVRGPGGEHLLFRVEGGEPVVVPGLQADDQPIRWSGDGRWLFAYRPGEMPARVDRVDARTGRRESWLAVRPPDPAGVLAITPVLLSADGRSCVFGYRRVLSDLYAVSGMR
jgi:Tol biopolymer transport system component